MTERMTRAKAKASGLTKYWPVAPCAKGHDAMRRVSGPCVVCEMAARRAWASANPDVAARSSASAWAKANPERHRANSAKWQSANMWYAVQAVNRRRARKAGADGHYTRAEIDRLIERQNGSCAHCGCGGRLEIDHIVPLARGGDNWPTNLQMLCRSCNAKKGAKLPNELSSCSIDLSLSSVGGRT